MRKLLRWSAIGAGGLVALLLVAAAAVFALSEIALRKNHPAAAETLAAPTPAQVAQAPRMAKVYGCTNCHGEGLKGRVMPDIPAFVARVVAPDIPEIAGRASDQQLAAAIRQGIGHDGRALYLMPSPQYSRLTDAEVAALIGWIRTLPRGTGGVSGKVTPGPVGRAMIAAGRLDTAPALVAAFRRQVPIALPGQAAGRHIAATACAECHGPALYGQQNAFGPAPDLRVAAGYDLEQFRTLMRTGRTPAGNTLGLMEEVARKDFVHMSDEEISALYRYLQARSARLGN